MSTTLVIQSHSLPSPADWIQTCTDSVKLWSQQFGYEYKFIDDALFEFVPSKLLEKTKKQKTIATDLARLKVLQWYLDDGYETVIWCDADFIIFNPTKFKLPDESYALGREVWVQKHAKNSEKLSAHTKVHNAFMMYRKGNMFLDFYADTAERLLLKNTGAMSPQFIGPKLLTALHNIALGPVLETAGMLSPLVIKDIVNGSGEALDLFLQESSHSIYAANVCNSLYERGEYSTKMIQNCLQELISRQKL
ncbi:MAG: hypothetical protein AAF304_03000 [Pseudomonadota bacterium]